MTEPLTELIGKEVANVHWPDSRVIITFDDGSELSFTDQDMGWVMGDE